jgi:hypothetical protein
MGYIRRRQIHCVAALASNKLRLVIELRIVDQFIKIGPSRNLDSIGLNIIALNSRYENPESEQFCTGHLIWIVAAL